MEKVKELTHKAKDAISSDKSSSHDTTGTYSTTSHTGPHSSSAANAADPRVDSDRDGSRNLGGTGHTGGGYSSTTTGGGLGGTTGGYSSNTTAGPHDSNLANKLDPRVDSDRDGSRNLGASTGGGYGGTTGGYGGTTGGYSSNTTAGPHDSNLANKADPRVDSDRDGSRNIGGGGGYSSTHTGGGLGSTGGYSSNTTAGPHDSNLANKADPRVDSDLDGSRNLGGSGGYGSAGHTTGGGYGSTGNTTSGPHSSNFANKLDPRVDSDRDGSRNLGASGGNTAGGYSSGGHHTGGYDATNTSATGPASDTAGPHSSNLLNKADPRVDSDLDSSGRRY